MTASTREVLALGLLLSAALGALALGSPEIASALGGAAAAMVSPRARAVVMALVTLAAHYRQA